MDSKHLNRVVFYSKEDLASGDHLRNGEIILRTATKSIYTDINEVVELYNLKLYIDNGLYLLSWTQEDIDNFKQKAIEYGKITGRFMSTIEDINILLFYKTIPRDYVHSFWKLVNNQNTFKRISKHNFTAILDNDPYLIYELLNHKSLVDYYSTEIRTFLLEYPKSAEILLSVCEAQDNFRRDQKFIPKSLTIQDKETIVSNYLDSNDVNLNYVGLIKNAKNGNDFRISDKTRLKAKRLYKSETEKILSKNSMKYGVEISFSSDISTIKESFIDESHIVHYIFNSEYVKANLDFYTLFKNFDVLFEYTDTQSRINLVSKKNQMGVLEKVIGIRSQNEYRKSTAFSLTDMASTGQIYGYSHLLNTLGISLESILSFIFTSLFQDKYGFPINARFLVPSATSSKFEKIRILAPEFESLLKQFKLFVEEGSIDFELLQISSTPSTIKDIPSLNQSKYIYFNEENQEIVNCSNLFFSDQTSLAYVKPFEENNYQNFFNLLASEQVPFSNYEEYQKPRLEYLIEKGFIHIDSNGLIRVTNLIRLLIIKDLYDNEVASLYHYSAELQKEVLQMAAEQIVFFESSLFSKPEQSYFNYILNKSEFTNGLDLRNSYLHGTQATPDEIQKHEHAYFTYLKILFLTMLKIEDDLIIFKSNN